MTDSFGPLFTQWVIPPAVTFALEVVAIIYVRGWLRIRRTRPAQFPTWRLACFLGGIVALFVAVASPLDTFSGSLLFMHMAQHFVLMSVAPPLVVLGAPVVPMLRGLPRWCIRKVLSLLFRVRFLHKLGSFLVRPRVAWLLMNLSYIGWHIPNAYELALRSESWHNFEHACFFSTSLLFWWPIIEPWPLRRHGSRWLMLPYLFSADIVNTGLSAFLCFAGRLVYPSYGEITRLFGISALNDQIADGALMWVGGSTVFLIPAMMITLQLLSPKSRKRRSVVRLADAG
jgi:cytochrome c oxidase assembly factor CtaG